MKKCIFITNLPSPYRVDFFNEFGKYYNLTVVYERKKSLERDDLWIGDEAKNFEEKYLNLKPYKADQSRGRAIIDYIKKQKYDYLIISNYASPSVLRLVFWCIFHKRDYYFEYDGGFDKKDSFFKWLVKKIILTHAKGHFASSSLHINYLIKLGIDENLICKYYFSSVKEKDILSTIPTRSEKLEERKRLGIHCEKMILTVGQFIYRKGFDILINASSKISSDVEIFIVGGEPISEYLTIIKNNNLSNIHFINFLSKNELSHYYKCSDLFVMPTREDVWGLVVNEAMSYGLPVISSDRCVSGLEMIENGQNGYIFKSENICELAEKINYFFAHDYCSNTMREKSLKTIQKYTIEKMAFDHFNYLEKKENK